MEPSSQLPREVLWSWPNLEQGGRSQHRAGFPETGKCQSHGGTLQEPAAPAGAVDEAWALPEQPREKASSPAILQPLVQPQEIRLLGASPLRQKPQLISGSRALTRGALGVHRGNIGSRGSSQGILVHLSLAGLCAERRILCLLGEAQHSQRAPSKQEWRVERGFFSHLIQQLIQEEFRLFESSLQRRRETKQSLGLSEVE